MVQPHDLLHLATAHPDDDMFVVKGQVEDLQVANGTLNLLSSINKKSACAGLISLIAEESRQIATAGMLAMYDGEDIQNFACRLGKHILLGTFPSVTFKDGDDIKAIVTRVDNRILKAHAIFRPRDNMLWMPTAIAKGRWQVIWWLTKACLIINALGALFFSALILIDNPSSYGRLMLYLGLASLGICVLATAGVAHSSRSDTDYAEEIMRAIGFKRPEFVNLSPFSEARLNLGGPSYQIYNVKRALEAYNSLVPGKTILDK